ncbi:MAG: DUF503 domain-containing protein [Chloroflexi bacterium]|nr:DUF503 domain-containing protein [Chloroflexota bacterium]
MVIGACKIKLHLPENHSLKGKRHVLKSIIARVRNEFNVAIAETDSQDLWQMAELGVCCVSNESRHANEMLSKVVDYIANTRLDIQMVDYEVELVECL